MVGGVIHDFFIMEKSEDKSIVKFLVKEISRTEYCCVSAEIPNDALEYNFIKKNQYAWWHDQNLFIHIEESDDVVFRKIGNSGGDFNTFYAERKEFLHFNK